MGSDKGSDKGSDIGQISVGPPRTGPRTDTPLGVCLSDVRTPSGRGRVMSEPQRPCHWLELGRSGGEMPTFADSDNKASNHSTPGGEAQ